MAEDGSVTRWLTIVGIGEDGVEALSPRAQALIAQAALVVGGARHLALAQPLLRGETLAWQRPIEATMAPILARRGTPVVVLASGDPFHFGVGPMIAARVPPEERLVLPGVSALSLAAASLGWSLQDADTISVCGRPVAQLLPAFQPGRRVLVLSEDGATPGQIAALLAERGGGGSMLHVFESLGGPRARHRRVRARDFALLDIDPLNLVAIEIDADMAAIPIAPGLDDAYFESDGQLTRHELRAAAIAALAPHPGQTLWDVGAGAGSVAIEWMLRAPSMRAVAFERHPERVARIWRNAASLGVPGLRTIEGEVPDAFALVEGEPDAVFVGGGGREPTLAEAFARLRPGGRIVAHSVTLETDAALFGAEAQFGGTLTRFSIERLDMVGEFRAFRPSMTVTQWSSVKP